MTIENKQSTAPRGGFNDAFHSIAQKTSGAVGSPWASLVALLIIIWAATGPIFGFSDTWQLVINTGTTIVTFLMVFLIQNTQNRDAKVMHLKLDEVIRALKDARNTLIDLEEMSEEEPGNLEAEFRKLRAEKPSQPEETVKKVGCP